MEASTRKAPRTGGRDSELCAIGYRMLLIWNNNVIENLDGTLETVLSELEKKRLTPALPASGARDMIDVASVQCLAAANIPEVR
jgi:hypothetical protein